jgi:amidophosphoribosyltransferase
VSVPVTIRDRHDDDPRDECGVLGISTPHGDGVAQLAFFGLFALQHRGQEAAGIAVSDGQRARLHKDEGLVSTVFTPEALAPLTGYHAIGHTRYSTTGSNALRNIQPFLVETMHGPLAVAHNGNLVNAPRCATSCSQRGFGLTATSDTEVLTLMLAAAGGRTWEERLERTLPAWKGAFSMVILLSRPGDRRARPVGLPSPLGGPPPERRVRRRERDLRPEHARLRRHRRGAPRRDRHAARCRDAPSPGPRTSRPVCPLHLRVRVLLPARFGVGRPQRAPRPPAPRESSSHTRRVDADVVIPVPDSSIPAAIGYSQASGIPFNDGLIKNRYIGRTFIEPTQDLRERGVALKFNALAENLAGKRVS